MTADKHLSDLIDDFQRRGLYGFDRSQLGMSLPGSPAAVSKALMRLAAKGRVKRHRIGSFYPSEKDKMNENRFGAGVSGAGVSVFRCRVRRGVCASRAAAPIQAPP